MYADWLPGMGLLTIVEHSGGYLSLYGHNEQLYRVGRRLGGRGRCHRRAGDSGGRNQPELYFEIRKGATPLNPHQWIRKSAAAQLKRVRAPCRTIRAGVALVGKFTRPRPAALPRTSATAGESRVRTAGVVRSHTESVESPTSSKTWNLA